MAAPMMKFVLHDSVPKALESCVGPESYGYLCGIWNREKWIVIGALSCRVQKLSSLVSQLKETLVLLPGGVGICGVYYGSQETITEEHVKQFAFKNLTAEFQEISGCESPCIVAVHLVAGVKPSNIYQYDIRNTVISQPACCISDVPSDKVVLRVQGKLRLSFDLSGNICETLASIRSAVSDLKQLVSSNVSAFHVRQSNVLLQKDASSSLMFVSDLWASLQTDDARAMEAKKKTVQKRAVVDVGLLLQTTGDNAVGRTLTCIPVIQLEMKAFTTVIHQLSIDAVAIVMESDPAAKMAVVLCQAVCRQLDAIDLSFRKFHKCVQSSLMRPHHFNPDMLEHLVTTIYPDSMDDAALESYRKELHERLHLPDDRPLLKRLNALFSACSRAIGGYLTNPHVGLLPSGVNGGRQYLVQGVYAYHHYMQDRIDDNHWGCAYRSLQTIISWFRHQGYTNRSIPTHREIQEALVEIGDKPKTFIDSRQWIGSSEVSFVLDHLLQVTSKLLFVNAGSEMGTKARELAVHFQVHGTPIMIGGGVLAHTILGVDWNEVTGDVKFLILDPHYTGGEDLKVIQTKGWCGWKSVNFWDQNAYYNMCMPQRPRVL